jgi:L-fuconolactonase
MRLDSHQHFWRYAAEEYPWIQPAWPIRRDFLPGDLQPLLAGAGLDGSIAVQARQTLPENRFLLGLADRHPFIRGVVGWVDLCCDRVEEQLAEFARHPRFVGVRHVVQDEPDDHFMLRPEFLRGIGRLKQFGLTYDILIFPRQLPAAIQLVARFPEQPFVLDHLAKPFIRDGTLSPWREQVRELARFPHLLCKVSGMVTEAKWAGWQPADFRPYLETVLECFGPERLMFGSDWPVCLLAAGYESVFALAHDFFRALPDAQQAAIFGGNAGRFYLGRRWHSRT